MKHLNVLTFAASLALAGFIASLALGLVSLPAFLGAAMTWVVLLTVYAYTPTRDRSWLPRRSGSAATASGVAHADSRLRRRATLPLAA